MESEEELMKPARRRAYASSGEDVNLNPPSVDGGETEAFPPNASIEKSISPGAEAKAFTPMVSIEKELPPLEIVIGIVFSIIIIVAFAVKLGFTFGGEVVSWFLGIVVVIASLSAVAPFRFLITRSIRRLLPQDPDQQRQQRSHRQQRQLRHEHRQQRRQSRRRKD